jgi:hypothetical protein
MIVTGSDCHNVHSNETSIDAMCDHGLVRVLHKFPGGGELAGDVK